MDGVRYRLYMESFGVASENFIVHSGAFLSFTIIHADGYWLGSHENTLILEVMFEYPASSDLDARIKKFCEEYRKEFNQDSVLVTKEEINMGLL